MKRKFLTICSSILGGVLLMSAAYPSGYIYYSNVAETNLPIVSILSSGTETTYQGANVTGNVAARITVTYELLSMDKTSVLYTNYVPVYSLIYRVDIFLDNDVQYKGGLFNVFEGVNPCYLNYISTTGTFEGLSSVGNVKQSPNVNDNQNTLRYLNDVDPYDGYGRSANNYVDKTSAPFNTCYGMSSASYFECIDDLSYTQQNFFNSRIAANLSSSHTKTSNSVNFNNTLTFGYHILFDQEEGFFAQQEQYYSGPKSDESPFYFSYYGAMNVESEVQPNNVNLTFQMNTTHGSSVFLDNFTYTVPLNIDIL